MLNLSPISLVHHIHNLDHVSKTSKKQATIHFYFRFILSKCNPVIFQSTLTHNVFCTQLSVMCGYHVLTLFQAFKTKAQGSS